MREIGWGEVNLRDGVTFAFKTVSAACSWHAVGRTYRPLLLLNSHHRRPLGQWSASRILPNQQRLGNDQWLSAPNCRNRTLDEPVSIILSTE